MDTGSPPSRRKNFVDSWSLDGPKKRKGGNYQRMTVLDRLPGSGGVKGQGEAARLGWGSELRHPAFLSPKVPGGRGRGERKGEAKVEALAAVGGPPWVRSKVKGMRALLLFPTN